MNRAEKRRQQKLAGKSAGSGDQPSFSVDITGALNQAVGHHQAGRLQEAEQLYQQILQAEPEQPNALNLLGMLADQVGQVDVAVELLTKAVNVMPGFMEAHNNLGNALKNIGEPDRAVVHYREAININPSFAEAHYNLGVALKDRGDLEEAIASYDKAIAVKSDYVKTHYNRGVALFELGRLEDAVASYQTALAINPGYAEAHSNLGNTFRKLGQLEEAVSHCQKAIELKPNFAKARINLGAIFWELGQMADARTCYATAIKNDPENAEIHVSLGTVYLKQDRIHEAVTCFQNALAIDSENVEALNNLGNAYCKLWLFDKAVDHCLKVVGINPDYVEAHISLGAAYQQLGHLEKSISHSKTALRLMPDSKKAHDNLGMALQDMGRLDEAAASYRDALAIDPHHAESYRYLSRVKKFSEYDQDMKRMEYAYAAPNLGDEKKMHLAFALGKAFEDMKQYEKAFEFFETGNAIMRGTYEFSIDTIEADFERLKALFSKKLFAEHQNSGLLDETPIFILGMPRSGTTLVEQILARHPKVFGAGELEVLRQATEKEFGQLHGAGFAEVIKQASDDKYIDLGRNYIKEVRKLSKTTPFITDKMPVNFMFIGLIKLALPNSKIIHCCRDPRDTCLSVFKNYFTADGLRYAYNLAELGRYYRFYSDLMKHWHRTFPGFVYDIHYADLVQDQEGQSRALIQHCGLEWDAACLSFYKSDRTVQTASSAQIRRPIYKDSVQLWKRYEKQLTPLLEAL